jgi:hypothetical protein
MVLKTLSPDGDKATGPNGSSPKILLFQILRDLAGDPSDLGALLRSLALALEIASTEYPTRRQVWDPQEREAYRSKGYLGRVDPAPAARSQARLKVIPLYSAGKPFSLLVFSGVRAPQLTRLLYPEGRKLDATPVPGGKESLYLEGNTVP